MTAFLRYLWLAVLCAAVFAAAGGAYAYSRTPAYTAEAVVLVNSLDPTQTDPGAELSDAELSTQDQIVESVAVANVVLRRVSVDESATDLLKSINVSQVGSARVLRIAATRANPDEAALLANSFARSYLTFRQRQYQARIGAVGKTIQSPQLSPGRVLTPATPPSTPAGTPPLLIVVLSGVLGLLVGALLATALTRRRTARTAYEPAEAETYRGERRTYSLS